MAFVLSIAFPSSSSGKFCPNSGAMHLADSLAVGVFVFIAFHLVVWSCVLTDDFGTVGIFPATLAALYKLSAYGES